MEWVKKVVDHLVNMLFRGVLGWVVVYGIELLCLRLEYPVLAGVNFVTFFASALLGVPGILFVYITSLVLSV